MKKSIFTYIVAGAVGVSSMLSSCSSDYLDVTPKTDISDVALTDPSVAKSLVDGIYQAMNVQYSALDWNQNCGEAHINSLCGDAMGMDMVNWVSSLQQGGYWSIMSAPGSFTNSNTWMYYYNLINLSNYVIRSVPATSEDYEGTESSMLLYKAMALTMRSHAYTRLLGYFGQRWEDSDNGEAYAIVIRTEPDVEATPLRKMNEVIELIYSDCDEACKLFDASGKDRSAKYEVNKSVALGIWSRAALLSHDWETAAEKAHAARQGYEIMDEADLFAGSLTDNKEVMWHMNPTDNTTYYWSYGSHNACNGAYTQSWSLSQCLNVDLYNELDPNDLRRKFFWMPDKITELKRLENPGGMTPDDFWNPLMVDDANALSMANTNVYDRTGNDPLGYGMLDCLGWWLYNYYKDVFTGDRSLVVDETGNLNFFTMEYTESDPSTGKKYLRVGKNDAGENIWVNVWSGAAFGTSCKQWAIRPYGNMALPWMRASEMCLTEAEAYYRMGGHENEAKAALTEVQSKRIPGYTCTTSGEALYKEIQVCRRIELYGEGFAFTDLKRWNIPRVRRQWIANDPTSGNCPSSEFAGYDEASLKAVQSTTYCNGWRFTIPSRETNYNEEIEVGLLKKIN